MRGLCPSGRKAGNISASPTHNTHTLPDNTTPTQVGDREFTLDDCWALELNTRVAWKRVQEGSMDEQLWKGEEDESEMGSEWGEEDSDEDSDYDGEEDEEEEVRKNTRVVQHIEQRCRRQIKKLYVDRTNILTMFPLSKMGGVDVRARFLDY